MICKALNPRYLLWALLALPSVPMVAGLTSGNVDPEHLLHPTGEAAARFMIVAMAITPLRLMFRKASWPVWMLQGRRYFGVAAFGYAVLHTVLYIIDMGTWWSMRDEFFALGIWTGWAAFAIFLPIGLTSNDTSQVLLRSGWKRLQRWVYAAAVLTLVHWIFVHNNMGSALVHFIPLALLEGYRIWRINVRGQHITTAGEAGAPTGGRAS